MRHARTAVIDTLAVTAVVFPGGSSTASPSALGIYPVPVEIVVGVAVEFVVSVNVDIHTVSTPTPAAATPDRGPDHNSGAEGHKAVTGCRRIVPAWVKPVRITPCRAVDDGR